METKIIKGEMIRDQIFGEVKAEIAGLMSHNDIAPCIAFIGFNCVPLSKYNIPMHIQMARGVGLRVVTEILPDEATEDEIFAVIDSLNANHDVHAIVLLQPLPEHLNPVRIVNRIDPVKEVEGFHPNNMIQTMIPDLQKGRYPMCLPTALYEMFKEADLQIPDESEWVFVLDDGFFTNSLTKMIVRSAASVVVPKNSPLSFINKESKHLVDHTKKADFLVIRDTEMPAILVEGGFISSPQERSMLKDPLYIEKIARGIVEGIDHYFKKS